MRSAFVAGIFWGAKLHELACLPFLRLLRNAKTKHDIKQNENVGAQGVKARF